MLNRLLSIAAMLAFAARAAAAEPNPRAAGKLCFHEGKIVRVLGRVSRRTFYGPPNFGETPKSDRRVTVQVIRFNRPLWPCELSDFDDVDRPGAPAREAVIVALAGQRLREGRQTIVGQLEHSDNANQFLEYIFVLANGRDARGIGHCLTADDFECEVAGNRHDNCAHQQASRCHVHG